MKLTKRSWRVTGLGAAWMMVIGSLPVAADEPASGPNRMWIGAEFLGNITGSFKHLGGYPARSNPGLPTGGIDHVYDDGYLRVDASGNADRRSWFWGYDEASQLPGNDTLVMHSYSAPADSAIEADDDPRFGVEFGYSRELGRFKSMGWGIEAVFGYADLEFSRQGAISTDAVRLTDAYGLGGVIAPEAPYQGTFEGPGPLISDVPTRTVTPVPGGSAIDGEWRADAALYGLRLGPYLEIPLTQRMNAIVSGGFVGASVDADLSFRETVSMVGAGSVTTAANGSRSDWLAGGYLSARVSLALAQRVAGFVGARYQHLGRFSETVEGRTAEINFDAAVTATVGIVYSF